MSKKIDPRLKGHSSLDIITIIGGNIAINSKHVQIYAKFNLWNQPFRYEIIKDFLEKRPPRNLKKVLNFKTKLLAYLCLIEMSCTSYSTFYPFVKMKCHPWSLKNIIPDDFILPRGQNLLKRVKTCQIIATGQKYHGNLVMILHLFWRFLKRAFWKKCLVIS